MALGSTVSQVWIQPCAYASPLLSRILAVKWLFQHFINTPGTPSTVATTHRFGKNNVAKSGAELAADAVDDLDSVVGCSSI